MLETCSVGDLDIEGGIWMDRFLGGLVGSG